MEKCILSYLTYFYSSYLHQNSWLLLDQTQNSRGITAPVNWSSTWKMRKQQHTVTERHRWKDHGTDNIILWLNCVHASTLLNATANASHLTYLLSHSVAMVTAFFSSWYFIPFCSFLSVSLTVFPLTKHKHPCPVNNYKFIWQVSAKTVKKDGIYVWSVIKLLLKNWKWTSKMKMIKALKQTCIHNQPLTHCDANESYCWIKCQHMLTPICSDSFGMWSQLYWGFEDWSHLSIYSKWHAFHVSLLS